jgi:hypothetical protein
MTGPLDDALRRTVAAVERYRVPQDVIARAADALARMPGDYRRETEVGALVDAIVEIADAHAGQCPDECPACGAVRNALAVAMGVIRAETDLELRRIYDEPL